MPTETIQIKRYPNRRLYARHTSAYVSLPEIEQMIRDGLNVEIRDSQSNEDITRTVLTQILLDHHPDKMALFPIDMLHFIVRSNDLTAQFLRDYFRHSLTYLEYLQQHASSAAQLVKPVHWVKAWLDGLGIQESNPQYATRRSDTKVVASDRVELGPIDAPAAAEGDIERKRLLDRVAQLERRLADLEEKRP